MRRNILSGVLSVISAKVATLLIGLATTPVLYRLLGPARFGEYTTVLSVHALFMIFVSSGITNGVRKYLAEDRPSSDWEAHVVGFYFRMAIALAALGAGGYLLAVQSGIVARVFSPVFEPYFTLMIAMVVAAQLWGYARRSLMGFGLERYSESLNVIYRIAFATVALTLVYLEFGVIGALWGQILGTLLVAVAGLWLVSRQVTLRAFVRRTPTDFPRRSMLTYNTMSVGLIFLMMSLYHVDIIMLQTFVGSTQVGNYKAALMLAEFLWFVPIALQAVYVHSTSELWSQDRHDRITRLASQTTRYVLLLTSVMALGLASLADVVVPLYWGREALPAITPLLLLLPGALGFATVRPTLAIEEGHGRLRYSLLATGSAAVINFGLNALLIPRFGMSGAAVATSVGYGSMLVFHIWSARKLGFDPLSDARLGRIATTTALAAGPILLLPRFIPGDITTLVVVPPFGLALYLTFAFATGALGIEECLDILSRFPGPIGGASRRLDAQFDGGRDGGLIPGDGQFWLLVLGILLFATGTGIALMDLTLGGPSDVSPDNNTTTVEPEDPADTTPATTDTETTTDSEPPETAAPTEDPPPRTPTETTDEPFESTEEPDESTLDSPEQTTETSTAETTTETSTAETTTETFTTETTTTSENTTTTTNTTTASGNETTTNTTTTTDDGFLALRAGVGVGERFTVGEWGWSDFTPGLALVNGVLSGLLLVRAGGDGR